MANTLLSKDFDSKNVTFSSKIENLNEGGTITSCKVGYRYSDGAESRLLIQTARMAAPFGISNAEKFQQPDKWSLQLSFRGEDTKKPIQQFRKCLEALDERIIQEAVKRPKELVHHDFDDDDDEKLRSKLIRKGFKSRISKPKDQKEGYSDTIRITIPWDKVKNAPRDYIKIYNKDNQETDWTAVTKGAEVVCLFSVDNVWSSGLGNTFGPTIKLVQCKIFSQGTSGKINSFSIKDEEDEIKAQDDDEDEVDHDAEETETGVDPDPDLE